jgi:hypothetical protein
MYFEVYTHLCIEVYTYLCIFLRHLPLDQIILAIGNHTYVWIYVLINTFMYIIPIYVYISMYMYLHVLCFHTLLWALPALLRHLPLDQIILAIGKYLYICMDICILKYMHKYLYISIYIYVYIYIYICTCICISAHVID